MSDKDIYNEAWQQFIHAGVEISFTDWLIGHMQEVRTEFQKRMDLMSARVNIMERQYVPRERIEMLERENQSLRQQMEFERIRNAAAPNIGHPRPEPGVAPPPEIDHGNVYGTRGRPDQMGEQRRLEDIRRTIEQFTQRAQDSDSG